MVNKYWVKYRYKSYSGSSPDGWNMVSCFVTVGEDCEFDDLEWWWLEESSDNLLHELLQVVKL